MIQNRPDGKPAGYATLHALADAKRLPIELRELEVHDSCPRGLMPSWNLPSRECIGENTPLDYFGPDDLLALDLTEDEARAVLAGQPQVAADEVNDRLEMFRRETDF